MRVFITGSTTGLGFLAAEKLLDDGHEVVLHARNESRAADVAELARRASGVVIGDLASAEETRRVAEQVNAIGGIDAVIHNAAVYLEQQRIATPEGHARTLAVNVLAPYMLTAWIEGPSRLIYMSSGLQGGGQRSLQDIDWTSRRWSAMQAYSDSKLFVITMANGLVRRRPEVFANSVNPGWVPTRMGGNSAPDDLEQGYLTQAWLAVSEDAEAMTSGGYWFHRRREAPNPAANDERFQDDLLEELAKLTGVRWT